MQAAARLLHTFLINLAVVIPKGVFFTNLRTQNANNTSDRREEKILGEKEFLEGSTKSY